ncbi:50S ribosomal protein L16 [Candidatus Woesebacteria bacterium]|nr:50S ribosomal protein L16 [Candidatus Woesebacteria bacterium]
MLQPKRSKFRFSFRGRRKGVSTRGTEISFGDYGLKALEHGWLAANQIESARRTIAGALKKGGRIYVRVFPDKPITARAAGHRMGGGKGEISKYVVVIKPGRVLFEIVGATREAVMDGFGKAQSKLSFKTKIISKE